MSQTFTFTKAVWPCTANRKSPLYDRFCAKVRQGQRGCWEWAGAHSAQGYAQIGHNRKVLLAHRVAYELFVGPIPEGLHIDHLCRNRGCVRPTHLEAVTQGENNQRAWDAQPERTVCRNGHQRAEFGYRDRRGRRGCRACDRISSVRFRRRQKEAVR